MAALAWTLPFMDDAQALRSDANRGIQLQKELGELSQRMMVTGGNVTGTVLDGIAATSSGTGAVLVDATANAAVYLGARIEFADIDPRTGLIDPAAVGAVMDRILRKEWRELRCD